MTNCILEDSEGNKFISINNCNENELTNYGPLTHCLAVVKVNNDYLLGWNKYRSRWEIFGGCRETDESARACIEREGYEELGILDGFYEYIGIMKFLLMPDYFSVKERIEYGALYGIALQDTDIKSIYDRIQDHDEIVKLALYNEVKDKEPIASIDEYLLKYY